MSIGRMRCRRSIRGSIRGIEQSRERLLNPLYNDSNNNTDKITERKKTDIGRGRGRLLTSQDHSYQGAAVWPSRQLSEPSEGSITGGYHRL